MIPAIPRADPHLNDAVRVLDQHLDLHVDSKGQVDYRAAFSSLGRVELEFVTTEVERCKFDSRYYLENYHVINTGQGEFRTLFPFWDSQEVIFERILAKREARELAKFIILKARQIGSSTLTQAFLFWLTVFQEGFNSLLVAQDPGTSEAILKMSTLAWESLPWWMRPEKRYEAKGRYIVFDRSDPVERLRHPGLRSQILVEAANKQTGAAVGKTFLAAHLSELCRWPGGGILTNDILPSITRAEFGVMESTALGEGNFWHMLWKDCIEGRLDWEPIFVEFFRRSEYSIPIPESDTFVRTEEEDAIAARVKEETTDHFEISDPTLNWRRIQINNYTAIHGDEWLFFQDYPLNWMEAFQASGLCAFDKRKLQVMFNVHGAKPRWVGEIGFDVDKRRPVFPGGLKQLSPTTKVPPQKTRGTRLFIWEGPDSKAKYYIGADVAYGIEGGDFSYAIVYKIGKAPHPDEQVAEWHGWIKGMPFAHVLAALGFFYGTCEVACEANDIGREVNNELMRGVEYPNIYRWKHIDKIRNVFTDFFGFETNAKTRPLIINRMNEAVDSGPKVLILRSQELITQMMSFGQSEASTRIEGQGGNDDRVMGSMIGLYCARELQKDKRQITDDEVDVSDPEYQNALLEAAQYLGEALRVGLVARGYGMNHPLGRGEQVPLNILEEEAHRRYRKKKSKGDFYNTDYSPIHDKPGPRREMFTKRGLPPEMISLSGLDGQSEEEIPEDEQWKLM